MSLGRWLLPAVQISFNHNYQIHRNQIMSSLEQLLGKLHKLKDKIVGAQNYPSLEKYHSRVEKLVPKVAQQKDNKDLFKVIEIIEQIVKEKTKIFKQKMIGNSSKNLLNQTQTQTLKNSKSETNFRTVPFSPTNQNSKTVIEYKTTTSKVADKSMRRNSKIPNDFQSSKNIINDAGESEVEEPNDLSITNLTQKPSYSQNLTIPQDSIHDIKTKLSNSMKHIQNLNDRLAVMEKHNVATYDEDYNNIPSSRMLKSFQAKANNIIQDYNQKLREKNFLIEDLQGKNDFLRSTNEELKNRLLAEKRRNEDLIEELKAENLVSKKNCEKYKKEVELLNEEISEVEDRNERLTEEVKKLAQKLQLQIREREKNKRAAGQTDTLKIKQLQKQISRLSAQNLNYSKIELQLQNEILFREQLQETNRKLQQRITQLEGQQKKFKEQGEKLEDAAYDFVQENKRLREKILVLVQDREVLAEQLIEMRERYREEQRQKEIIEYEKQMRSKNKLTKLKEIKCLLTELY